jgi:hypothetical protein
VAVTYPVNATFRPRPPWFGGHLQTVRDRIARPRYPLPAADTQMVAVVTATGSPSRFTARNAGRAGRSSR